MFLKKLKIEKGNDIIREINFQKGVNLIVDETPNKNQQISGNNVGKTTVLRLIDYCLGGKGDNIYKDTEFPRNNGKIASFLKNNNVIITLTLKANLDNKNSQEITIQRNFISKIKKKILTINNEQFTTINFTKKLRQLIFNSSIEKPTFRQIIAKNIRDEKNKLVHTLKVLHNTTKRNEYETLYLFWLGINLERAGENNQLVDDKKRLKVIKRELTRNGNLSVIEQSLNVVETYIGELEIKRKTFEYNPDFEKEIIQLDKIKYNINQLSLENGRLTTRRDLILESKNELEKDKTKINIKKIESLYENAKALIPNIQKTFEETLNFHNQMIENKVNYIIQELPTLEKELRKVRSEIKNLLDRETNLTNKLQKNQTMESLQEIIKKLTIQYEEKGKLLERKSKLEEVENKLGIIYNKKQEIDQEIQAKDSTIQQRISDFNNFFSKISNQLYREQFILSSDNNDGNGYELNISTIGGNPGTGKKRGEIAAFDLAYIQFAEKLNIKCLHFILHDQIETVHENQLSNILTNIVSEINCQYIITVLKDKLPNDINIEPYKILSLSQEEKLFKIKD